MAKRAKKKKKMDKISIRKRRGQAAMEFIMSYGWAIFAALLVVGVLGYIGVYNAEDIVDTRCEVQPPLRCIESRFSQDAIEMVLHNNFEGELEISRISVEGCGDLLTTLVIPLDDMFSFSVPCSPILSDGDIFNGNLEINYRRPGSTHDLITTGKIYGAVSGFGTTLSQGECSDGVDNGDPEDNLVDLEDFGCESSNDPSEVNNGSYQCNNGQDDDLDGDTDEADSDCQYYYDIEFSPARCNDGLDNDGDNYTDYPEDWGCANYGDNLEDNAGSTECTDGADNDGDLLIDRDDPHCDGATDNNETEEETGGDEGETGEICDNGVDDDFDTAIDLEDTDCYSDGTIYYIATSPSGNDSWDGLSPVYQGGTTGPKSSFASAVLFLENANPGDKVLLRKGDSWPTTSVGFFGIHGNSTHPVTLGSYGVGASYARISDLGAYYTFNININDTQPTEYLVFDGLEISPAFTSRPTAFNIISSTPRPNHITFRNLYVHGIGSIVAGSGDYLTIEDSLFLDNYDTILNGIYLSDSQEVDIRNNYFERNRAGSSNNVIRFVNSNDTNVEGNYFGDEDTDYVIRLWSGSSHRIHNNTFENVDYGITLGGHVGTFVEDVELSGNIFSNVPRSIQLKTNFGNGGPGSNNISIFNNILHVDEEVICPTASCYLLDFSVDPISDIRVMHNTFYTNSTSVASLQLLNTAPVDLDIKYNIFQRDQDDGTWRRNIRILTNPTLSGISLNNNLYYTPNPSVYMFNVGSEYQTLANFQAAFPGQENNGEQADPLFMNLGLRDFHLQPSSPAVNGVDFAGEFFVDIEGTLRPLYTRWDIGAYEYE